MALQVRRSCSRVRAIGWRSLALLACFAVSAGAAGPPVGGVGEDAAEPWYEWPLDPGPSWNAPRVSLPGCMGVLKGFQTEWWYYVGHAYDAEGHAFSLQLQAIRGSLAPDNLAWQVVIGTAGIGMAADESYLWSVGYGLGVAESGAGFESLVVPPARDDAYEVLVRPLIHNVPSLPLLGDGLRFVYSGGEAVGTAGSRYTISGRGAGELRKGGSAEVAEVRYAVELAVTDQRGMVLEGSSGYVGPPKDNPWHGAATYEFAQPSLRITGGTLTVGGEVHALVRGSLWLDRQVLSNPRPEAEAPPRRPVAPPSKGDLLEALRAPREAATTPSLKPLYVGTWMGIVLDDGTTAMLASFWQQHAEQWLTGTRVGRPPADWMGNVYLRPREGMANGGMYLRKGAHGGAPDFDVNILSPRAAAASPHWTSPTSQQTYATAWQVRFSHRLDQVLPRRIYVRALVDGCENLLPDTESAFWEGAAEVYADPEMTHPIGHAFVEQMGFD